VEDFCGEGLEGVDCRSCSVGEGGFLGCGVEIEIEAQGGPGEIEGVDY
jgi:hypothetical protein